jgi:EmrB/QacA subfamily drug resistance transporter
MNNGTKITVPKTARKSVLFAGHQVEESHLPMILTLALGVFAGALDLGVLSPALSQIAKHFAIAPRDVAWLFTLYLFANVVSIPVMSKLSDTYGRRTIYILCVTIFAVGSVLAIIAPHFNILLLARAIQAIGSGGIFPVAVAAIGDRIPAERRGSALGLLGAVWGLAGIIGPNLGGVITHFFSWHWIFIANVPLSILVIIAARKYVPNIAAQARGPLDISGIITLALGLLGVMIGLTRIDVHAASIGNAWVYSALALALVAFITLAKVERRATSPIISPSLFATRQLVLTYTMEILIGLLEGALFFIPAALMSAEHLSAAVAGAIAAIGAIVFVAVIPAAGRALDSVGSRAVLTIGSLLTGIGLAIFAFSLTKLPMAIFGIVISGIGFGALLGAPTRYIITNEAPGTLRATAIGLLSIFLIIGQIVGGSLAGGILGKTIDNTAGYRNAYEIFALIAAIAMLSTFGLKSREDEQLDL